MMRIKKVVAVIIFACVLGLITFGGYKGGYSWGMYHGYEEGYKAGSLSFPRMDIEQMLITKGGNVIELRGITITGEQHIIDTVTGDVSSIVHFSGDVSPDSDWAYVKAIVYTNAENITGNGWSGVSAPTGDGQEFRSPGNGLGFWLDGYYVDIYAHLNNR